MKLNNSNTLIDALVKINVSVLNEHIVLRFCFTPLFVGILVELSLDKICQYYICLIYLLSGKFAAPLWIPACNFLVCGGAGNNQSELLLIEISEDWELELLTAPLMWFSLSGKLSAVPKGTCVDFIDPYLLGMLRHTKTRNGLRNTFIFILAWNHPINIF